MNKIACIDVDHIFFLCLTGEKILDENGIPIRVDNKFAYRERTFEESCNIADNYITNILNITDTTHYIGFMSGSSFSRKQINRNYKANRKDLEPLKNLTLLKRYLAEKWNFIWLNVWLIAHLGIDCVYETDDFVASFIKQIPDSFIVSPDKDLLNLEGTHYNPKKNEWVTTIKEDEELFFLKSLIVGDTADNIPGVKGLGEKAFEGIKQTAELINVELPVIIFRTYLQNHSTLDMAISEFYKNYKCLKLKTDLDISLFTPIEWKKETDDYLGI